MFGDKSRKNNLLKIIILFILTIVFYLIYYIIFGEIYYIITSIAMSIASIPLNILFTSFIINYIVDIKDKIKKDKEVEILTSLFFNEIGIEMLDIFTNLDKCIEDIRKKALIKKDWAINKYEELYEIFKNYESCINIDRNDLRQLKIILDKKSSFILDLLFNPALDDKEDFTDLIVQVLHVRDEINHRFIGDKLEDYEKIYIESDINKLYKLLCQRWVNYMLYLKKYYPQAFIKSLVNSPFDNRNKKEKDREFLSEDCFVCYKELPLMR